MQEPIIKPLKRKQVEVEEHEKDRLEPNYSLEFMAGLMQNPDLVRNVAVIGHLHHGKTLLMDMLVEQTHDVQHEYRSNEKELRYTDTRLDEQVTRVSSPDGAAVGFPLTLSFCMRLMPRATEAGSVRTQRPLTLRSGRLAIACPGEWWRRWKHW
jgi:hypothetical protein